MKPEDDDAGQAVTSCREEVAEIEVKGQDDSILPACQLQDLIVRKPLQAFLPEMNRLVSDLS